MKKRFLAVLALTSALVMIVAVCAVSVVYYNFYKDEVIQEIDVQGRLLAHSLAQMPEDDLVAITGEIRALEKPLPPNTRLTLVNSTGQVLYDSNFEAASLPSHQDREEIQAAFAQGEGGMTRYSQSVGAETYYFATKISDNLVLRIAKEMKQISSVFTQAIPVVVGMIGLLLLICLFIATKFTKRLINPLYSTLDQVRELYVQDDYDFKDLKCYDEIAPFIREIKNQNLLMKRHFRELQIQRDTIDNITKNMSEGLILLNQHRKILAINESAKTMLGALEADQEQGFIGSNILRLSRSLELQEALEVAEKGEVGKKRDVSFVTHNQGRSYRYFVSPVNMADHLSSGAMILIMDITEQMGAENMRRDFAANVSHELKTPLTAINGFAELMAAGLVKDDVDTKKFAALIHKESTRLISLIEDIIRLSQIENNKAEILKEVVPLSLVLTDASTALQELAKNNDVTVDYDFSGCENLEMIGGRTMIYELLYNLGQNAIKYNRPGGSVRLTLSSDTDKAVFTVKDTGIGIDEADLAHIFERFYRADKSRSRDTGGTGLGLSIVKHIVEYYGGEIEAHSVLGQGTTFVAKLPLK